MLKAKPPPVVEGNSEEGNGVEWCIKKSERGVSRGTFQVYIFKCVQIVALFFVIKISTIFYPQKQAQGAPLPLSTPLMAPSSLIHLMTTLLSITTNKGAITSKIKHAIGL